MATPIAGDRIVQPDKATIARILATIRKRESGNNYTIKNKHASASGAYQYVNSTWRGWANRIAEAAPFANGSAADAPAKIQDLVAEVNVRSILATHNNQLAAIPVVWYYPSAWGNDQALNSIPPFPGNTQSVRTYAEGWIRNFDKIDPAKVPAGGVLTNPGNFVVSDVGIGDVLNAGIDAATGLPIVGGVIDAATAVPKFIGALLNPGTWIRVAQVIGGVVMVTSGVFMFTQVDNKLASFAGKIATGK
jgi:hypothetical protein